jgi:hypothetical protein
MRTAEENIGAQIAYDVAYFVLPRRAHADLKELQSEFEESPDVWAMFYYAEAAKKRGTRPKAEHVRAVCGHTGRLDKEHNYIVVEYPRFPVVDLLADLSSGLSSPSGYVLAPYFSAVVTDRASAEAQYYVLGQSPDARTTLRLVSPDVNANLGPGCEPKLKAFLEILRKRVSR